MTVFTVPPRFSLPDVLAEWVTAQYSGEDSGLSQVLLLLPSRRSIRAVREAFLRASGGKALLLPQMQALGDLDEKSLLRFSGLPARALQVIQEWPPVMEEYPRLVQIARLISGYDAALPAGQALQLADELISLLDEMQREQVDTAGFDALAPAEFSAQWQEVLEFLKIIREYWPRHLQESGREEPWQRRNRILALLAEAWRESPPPYPVIAAGTTGSIPAVAALLKVVAGLEQGSVILPGLDMELSEEAWEAAEESHPQYGLKQLLAGMKVERGQVASLPSAEQYSTNREKWISASLMPVKMTENWHQIRLDTGAALRGSQYLPCRDISEEARIIALLLREVLETPGRTAALVTPNRDLARRVRSQLQRWEIYVDDSAGTPLDRLPGGNFLLLLLRCVEEGHAPVSLLSLFKHPLLRMGMSVAEIRGLVRRLEIKSLRGLKPHSLAVLQAELCADEPMLTKLLTDFERMVEPLAHYAAADCDCDPALLIDALLRTAEALSGDEQGKVLLWQGEEAADLSALMRNVWEAAGDYQPIPFRDFYGMLKFLLGRAVFRSSWQRHPRLHILSPIEARMQSADRVILAGLNEGEWPGVAVSDLWLSRPMRRTLGLPPPERETGQSAHDFALLACAAEVYLTRAEKTGGAVTVPSRFLQRMETVLRLAGGEDAVAAWQPSHWRDLAEYWERATEDAAPLAPPCPVPPVSSRPRRLSVTSLERLMRDPYGIYAQKILRLRKLEELHQLPQGREFGEAVHQALEKFIMAEGMHARDPRTLLLEKGKEAFNVFGDAFMVESLWWPRFLRIADWVLAQQWPAESLCEIAGEWKFPCPAGEFTVTARVDRVDRDSEGVSLIDYKTGGIPANVEVQKGLASQLTLAAVMVGKGSFGEELGRLPVMKMEYWKLTGGASGGEIKAVEAPKGSSLEQMIQEAEVKVRALVAEFDRPDTPYPAVPDWRLGPRYNDYSHLARIAEWE